jgi:hypothetical protein
VSVQLLLFWCACAALFLLPGALMARPIPVLWSRLGMGERLLPSFLLSAGFLGLIWTLASAFVPTVKFAISLWLGGCVVLAIVALAVGLRRGAREVGADSENVAENEVGAQDDAGAGNEAIGEVPFRPALVAPAGRLPVIGALALCLLALIAMLHEGGSLGYIHDSLDFVAFVNRMLETGRIDIVSGAYRNVEGLGADPRRGAFHVGMAMVCELTQTRADAMWRSLPVVLVPLSLWVFFASMRRILESAPAAFFALLFLVATTLFQPDRFLHNLAYASRLGWVYSWVAVWGVALFLDADRTDKTRPLDWSRSARRERGVVGRGALLLAALAPAILIAIHVLSAAQCLISLAAFCWVWAFSRKEPRPVRRRLAFLPLWALVFLLPGLALKLMSSFSAENPLFDHPQGLLYLWDHVPMLAPGHLVSWFGWPGLLGSLLVIPLLPRMLQRRDFAYVIGGTAIAAIVLLNPVAVLVIERFKAHSLLFRIMLVVPFFATLGIYAAWSLRRLRDDPPGRRWVPPLLFLLLASVFLTLNAREAARFFSVPEFRRGPWIESQPLLRGLEFLERKEGEPQVVVSDPITSYQIPAYSRHYAIAPFNQHSSPADDRAIERIYDAHAIGNAYVPLAKTVELLRKYDADYVLINQSFPRYVKFYYTFIAPESWPAELAKFTGSPEIFEPVYGVSGIHLFRFHDPGPGTQFAVTENPYELLTAEEADGWSARDLTRRLGIQPVEVQSAGGLEMLGVVWDTTAFRAGDYVKVRSFWRRRGPRPTLPLEAFYRVSTTYPSPLFDHPWIGKPYRRFYEKRAGLTYRFGRMHQPLERFFPPFLWEAGAVYWDEFWIPAPRHAAPGAYEVSVKLNEVPYTPNFRLTDFFRVEDSLEGQPIGRIEILPPLE